jgi:predicted alpha/beta hydrolase
MTPEAPQLATRATLSDLMDRLLDRGLFLRADLVISVAGIPLIGASLSLALAGMETMLNYGVMNDWDREMRAEAN